MPGKRFVDSKGRLCAPGMYGQKAKTAAPVAVVETAKERRARIKAEAAAIDPQEPETSGSEETEGTGETGDETPDQ